VITHSLGCLHWLAYAARRAEAGEVSPVARRVVLVAPPARDVVRGIREIASFEPALGDDELGAALEASAAEGATIVAGDEDPYCPEGAEAAWATPLGATLVVVPGGGHVTIEDGFGPFPLVRDLVTS
jgi:predicted alpha/beta hydrolase family esterase